MNVILFMSLFTMVLLVTVFGVARASDGGAYGGAGLRAGHRRSPASSVGLTERVSVASDSSQANGASAVPSISADGRYIAFQSLASDLVAEDTNECGGPPGPCADVFVRDRVAGVTERVSVATDGTQGNGSSGMARISADGRYVAFSSSASNLVPGDTNGYSDIFVHDRETRQTERVSVASDGSQANDYSADASISADGRYVAFRTTASNLVSGDTNGFSDIFVHDRETRETERVSIAPGGIEANGGSGEASISAGGRFVAFSSGASNLVPGDTNGQSDVFVHDRETDQTERMSVSSNGSQANWFSYGAEISADGRAVAFASSATNLVAGDTNGYYDVFVRDRQTGQTERVSVASDGTQGNRDSGGGTPLGPMVSISADGHTVAFASFASNLVPDDTNSDGPFLFLDLFVHNRETGHTERVSVASDGTEADGASQFSSVSGDGRYVAFDSYADNLVPADTNEVPDIFVRDQEALLALETDPVAVTVELRPWDTVEVSVTISNTGVVAGNWTLVEAPDVDWLNLTTGAGSLEVGGSMSVTLALDATGLELGEYESALVLTMLESGEQTEIPVTLLITAPALEMSPARISMELHPWESVETSVVVSNTGDAAGGWTLTETEDIDGLTLVPASGTLEPGEKISVTVALDAAGLEVGEYESVLVLTLVESSEEVTQIPVTITVKAGALFLPFILKE